MFDFKDCLKLLKVVSYKFGAATPAEPRGERIFLCVLIMGYEKTIKIC